MIPGWTNRRPSKSLTSCVRVHRSSLRAAEALPHDGEAKHELLVPTDDTGPHPRATMSCRSSTTSRGRPSVVERQRCPKQSSLYPCLAQPRSTRQLCQAGGNERKDPRDPRPGEGPNLGRLKDIQKTCGSLDVNESQKNETKGREQKPFGRGLNKDISRSDGQGYARTK